MSDLNDDKARGGTNIQLQTWSAVELGLAILASCLAALRPLVRLLTGGGRSHTPERGRMPGRFMKQSQALELQEVGHEASSIWSGVNDRIAKPDPPGRSGVTNDSRELILNNLDAPLPPQVRP